MEINSTHLVMPSSTTALLQLQSTLVTHQFGLSIFMGSIRKKWEKQRIVSCNHEPNQIKTTYLLQLDLDQSPDQPTNLEE